MLPITPPDQFKSPYSSPSAFAGNVDFLSTHLGKDVRPNDDDNYWIQDWCLYSAIKQEFDHRPWFEWPQPLRDRNPEALKHFENKSSTYLQSQIQFSYEWSGLKEYASSKNIELIGDVPIFVNHDSADVWAHRELFLLDEDGMPTEVAGTPPDYFNKDGQKWGTVLYNWEAHRKDNWKWWIQRMNRMKQLFHIVRIDHFLGFDRCWAIPTTAKNGKKGRWLDGPVEEIVPLMIDTMGGPHHIIAENLGIATPEAESIRIEAGIPGMSVLQFGYDGDFKTNPHHPSNYDDSVIVYTGTHDNNTLLGWWNELPESIKLKLGNDIDTDELIWSLIRLAFDNSQLGCIVPLQDLLELPSSARMNFPGTLHGNWLWSLNDLKSAEYAIKKFGLI